MIRHSDASWPSISITQLDYCDITWFIFIASFLPLIIYLGVAARLLSRSCLTNPPITFQGVAVALLIFALTLIVRFRSRRSPLAELGWRSAKFPYFAIALLGGCALALTVAVVPRGSYPLAPRIHIGESLLLAVFLGPILEESFFRGCLLPVVAQSLGPAGAVIFTSVIFSLFHRPPSLLHFLCFTLSGIAYAWIRIASRSTATPALMHATYNLVLLGCASFALR